jgi:transcriptional regulator with XRE-family HTH domain
MNISQDQIRAGRALVHLDQADLAQRAGVSPVTIRRIESGDGTTRVAPTTLETVQRALENAGVEFIPHGVRRRIAAADREARFRELQAIAKASAAQLRGHDVMTETDLYDENGLPG